MQRYRHQQVGVGGIRFHDADRQLFAEFAGQRQIATVFDSLDEPVERRRVGIESQGGIEGRRLVLAAAAGDLAGGRVRQQGGAGGAGGPLAGQGDRAVAAQGCQPAGGCGAQGAQTGQKPVPGASQNLVNHTFLRRLTEVGAGLHCRGVATAC